MDEVLKEWDLLFKNKLPQKDSTVPHFENFLNDSSNASCLVHKNCTPYCAVRAGKKVGLQTCWPLKRPHTHLAA